MFQAVTRCKQIYHGSLLFARKWNINFHMMNSEPEKSHQWPQILAVMTTLILVTSTGVHAGWTSPAIPKLIINDMGFEVTKDEASYMAMIYPLGYILAGPTTAFLLDKIGRKFSLLLLAAPQILAWFLIAVADTVYVLYASRLISGFAEGNVFSIVPVYICEVSEPLVRGRLGVSYTTAFTFGFFLINCYGSHMPIRASACISLCLPLVFVFTFIWMPETPYYFLIKGDTERARTSLQRLRRMNNVDSEMVNLTADIQRQTSESGTIKDVFTIESNLKALFILIGLRTLQQFSGGASVIYYSQIIFQQVGGHLSFSLSAIIFTASLTVVSCTGLFLVDKYGRRPLLLLSVSTTGLCLLVEAIYFTLQHCKYDTSRIKWVPITGMIFYTIVRGFGLLSIPTLMTGELFSASVKAKAMGILNTYVALCISGTSKIFQLLDKHFGMHAPFTLFVVGSILGVVFVYYCVPETKGKTLEEIQQKLKGNIS